MTLRSWPGLIDLQVNGFRGLDVNADDIAPDRIAELTRELWAEGVTTYLPTVVTAPQAKIEHILSTVAEARRRDPLIRHSIAGVHIEGPSLSEEDGPRGAHDAEHLRDPSLAELASWQRAGDGLVRVITLAPERAGALEYIAGARAQGIRVSIGHCATTPERIREAATAGATLSTHLGNGAHMMLPRHPNHVWAQLACDELTAMFIADGHHLPADALTAMIRAKGVQRSILTSDAAALAGAPPGVHHTPVGGDVIVEDDGRLTLAGTGMLAGSGASLRACLDWAVGNLPFTEDELLTMVSRNPARILQLENRGDSIEVSVEDGIRIHRVTVAGAVVHEQ